jgi:hypothetical protein
MPFFVINKSLLPSNRNTAHTKQKITPTFPRFEMMVMGLGETC